MKHKRENLLSTSTALRSLRANLQEESQDMQSGTLNPKPLNPLSPETLNPKPLKSRNP